MLIKSDDRYVKRLENGVLVYVGPIGKFLDNIQVDVIQGPMGIQGPSGADGGSIPKPYFKAGLSQGQVIGATGYTTIEFNTLIDDYNTPGFDIANYKHKPDGITIKELWHYDVSILTVEASSIAVRVMRDDLLTVIQDVQRTSELNVNFSFSLEWQSDDDPILIVVALGGGGTVSNLSYQTFFSGYRVGFLEAEQPIGGQSGTEDLQVSSGPDDAHQADDNSGFNHTAVTLRVEPSTTASARWNSAMRFVVPNIPQGATITAAWLEVVFPASQRDSPRLTFYGELIADAPDFATNQTVNGRQKTAASVTWSGDDLGSGSFIQSPDLSSIIQEIVNQPAWLPDNGMVIIAIADSVNGPEATRFTPYDSVPANACKLHIEWQTP